MTMAYMVDAGAMTSCSHQGTGTATVPSAKVTLGGQGAMAVVSTYTIKACTNQVSGVSTPCLTGTFTQGSSHVFVEGKPALLSDAQGQSDYGTFSVTGGTTQQRVTAQ
jgi:hypothetical protein